MKWKKTMVFWFFILAGIVVGGMLASLTKELPLLEWLSYGKTIGIGVDSPPVIDLSVVKLSFGMEIGINVAQILCIGLAIFAARGVKI